MVTHDGRAKILDFGLAKVAPASAGDSRTVTMGLTEAGKVMGTVGYMSPEQVRGQEAGSRSDIFSFGTVLYEMLAGKRAFQGDTAVEVMNAILKEDAPELPESTLSGARAIVSHCLEKKPEQRFQSAKDLAFALRAVGGRTISTPDAAVISVFAPRRLPVWMAAAGLLAGVIVGGVTALRWATTNEARIDPIQLTRFAAEPAEEDEPAFSPDGRSVAYMRIAGANSEIVVQALGATTPLSLVGDVRRQAPVWTPDGTRVCYTNEGLWCVSAVGGTPQRLMANARSAAFTRDGKSLLFLREENGKPQLFLSSPPGAEAKLVPGVTLPENANALSISPDASKLLVNDFVNGASIGRLWIIPYPNGSPRELRAPGNPQMLSGAWFPDSRHVAVSESIGQTFKLLIADSESSARRLVETDTGTIISAAVSPDGKRIMCSTGQLDDHVMEYSMADGKRVPLAAASTNLVELNPSWAPSGEHFLYTVEANGGPTELWTRNSDGSARSRVLANASTGVPSRYSPDGRRIAYIILRPQGTPGIETIPSVGGRPVRIVSIENRIEQLCWSADGEWLWYEQSEKVWKVSSQGGSQPAAVKDQAELVDCSPDGRIGYASRDGLHLISPDGKQDRVIVDLSGSGQFGEGGKVLYLRRDRKSMDVIDVETGKTRRTIEFELSPTDNLATFSVRPDGKVILFYGGGRRYDLWMAEGFAQPAKGWMSWFRHWEIPSAPVSVAPPPDAPE
jgi:Tol biopolymer transport system component